MLSKVNFAIHCIIIVILNLTGCGHLDPDINSDSKSQSPKINVLNEAGVSNIFCLDASSFIQKDDLLFNRTIGRFSTDSSAFFNINFMWLNPTNETYILWLNDKYNSDSLSPERVAHLYFFTQKGDFRLIDLFYDTFSIESYQPYLYDKFIKILKPNRQFNLSILAKNEGQNVEELSKFIQKQMVSVKWSPALMLPNIERMGILDYEDITMTIMLKDIRF